MKWVSPVTFVSLLGLAAPAIRAEAPAAPLARTPTSRTPPPARPSLSAGDKAQAHKVLAAAVGKRQVFRGKPASGAPAGFQAHRCAVLSDPTVYGKERDANGPFRTTCSDWVSRRSQSLAEKDANQPCAAAQYGPSFAGCSSWVDHWDAGSGKWVVVWKKSSP